MRMSIDNPLKAKSYAFAVRIVLLAKEMERSKEFVLSKQLLRSGTSIGANIEEGLQGQSRRDFISKLSISLKEAFETQYWLRLIADTKIVDPKHVWNEMSAIREIIRLLTTIIKTTKLTPD